MYCVKQHKTINQITSLFYRLGLWHRGEEPTARENKLKIFYSIYFMLFPVSLLWGAIKCDNKDESIFLVVTAIIIVVLLLKLFYILWKQKLILSLLNQICVYSTADREDFNLVNDKLKRFGTHINFLFVPTYLAAVSGAFIVPFLGEEKKLFFDIGFPLDYKNNEIAFWIAFTFLSSQLFIATIAFLFSPFVWYLMMTCSLKYDVLGSQITKMGVIKMAEASGKDGKPRKISRVEKVNKFVGDFIETIRFHHRIREEIHQMASFLSILFMVQVATSGLCICGSIYNVLFSISETLVEYLCNIVVLFYSIFQIFMVMHFGNEIQFSSDHLTYCLFQSDWVNQPETTKKLLIIFGEIIKQPSVLVVAKLYPLTFETFTRILNSAYSMFNILKNLK